MVIATECQCEERHRSITCFPRSPSINNTSSYHRYNPSHKNLIIASVISSSASALFQPHHVGTTQHRIVMVPLTCLRANKDHVHGKLAKTYCAQRSSVPGTLIILEATFITQAAGYANVPGIWNDVQITGWKTV
ncbi:NADH oxidase family-domain-containing protein [Lactarius indigo]|nr:NADH oxidase family-domain-containing protein [Lactarius indigo]